jgi:hypothetical protein
MKGLFLFCALLVGLYWLWENSEISHPAGIVAPDEPHQREVYAASIREKDGYRIMPLATFDIRARVIARERYRFARAADLSPIDLVLGWGAMSDTTILDKISFSHGGRAYTWMTSVFPVPRRIIETHSANMHMIPANGDIERRLKSVRAGNVVHIKGFLVEVSAQEGWRWKSSLTRDDTCGGACELILVESLDVW